MKKRKTRKKTNKIITLDGENSKKVEWQHDWLMVLETSHNQNNCGNNHKAALNDKPTDSPQWFFMRSSIQQFSFEDKGNCAVYNKDFWNALTPCKNIPQCDLLNI